MSSGSALATITEQGFLRPIRREDNAAVAAIIRAVLTEFGIAGPGTAFCDPEVDAMFETYAQPGCAYFVAEQEGRVIGCCGIAPLKGGGGQTCELQKYYLLPQSRGLGYGQKLLAQCLEAAKTLGYARCYLETVHEMTTAQALYLRAGFTLLDAPLGNTGHTRCTRWYVREL